MPIKLILVPFISALIGWLTNFIAVKMLFHPKKKINLLVFTIQGIFPKRQAQLAEKIGHLVASELISFNDISSAISSPSSMQTIKDEISEKLDDYFEHKLAQKFPIIGSFLSGGIKETIKNEFLNEFMGYFPSVVSKLSEKLEQTVDIQEIVRNKVSGFSTDKLEMILMDILKKEFRFIEVLGAIIGFLIGLIQIVIFYL